MFSVCGQQVEFQPQDLVSDPEGYEAEKESSGEGGLEGCDGIPRTEACSQRHQVTYHSTILTLTLHSCC